MKAQTITTSALPKRTWLARAIAALLVASALAFAPHANARTSLFVSVNLAPPPLPYYVQPAIPGPGYIWTPGYWAYDEYDGYYWVPGAWVRAPYYGALWTPGYWAYNSDDYVFYPGYWGLSVGYYGGIDYGFGYTGIGYYGGYWGSGGFYYNTTVNNITINQAGTTNITNIYTRPVTATTTSTASFNGPGGVTHQATQTELANSRQKHTNPVSEQIRQQTLARQTPSLRASANHGSPPITATTRAGTFDRTGARTGAMATAAAATAATGWNHHQQAAATTRTGALRSASFAPRHEHGTRQTTRTTSLSGRTTTTGRMSTRMERGTSTRRMSTRVERSRATERAAIHREAASRSMRSMHASRTLPERTYRSNIAHNTSRTTALNGRASTRMERSFATEPAMSHRDVTIQPMRESRPSPVRSAMGRESIQSHPVVQNREPAVRMNESTRFTSERSMSNGPSMPPMHQDRQVARNQGTRDMPSVQGPRTEGPRTAAPSSRQGPAPRGGEKQPSGDKKDHDHGGG
jgi:hypothetical protein